MRPLPFYAAFWRVSNSDVADYGFLRQCEALPSLAPSACGLFSSAGRYKKKSALRLLDLLLQRSVPDVAFFTKKQ